MSNLHVKKILATFHAINQLKQYIMAKMKMGQFMVDLRGKNGGTVNSKNRGGAYTRNKVTPSNGQTTYQVAVRNRLTQFAQAWRSLTEAQRTAWNAAVENFKGTDVFGDVKVPSGINLYIKLNTNLALANIAAISTPPLPTAVAAVTALTVVADTSAQSVTVTFTPTPVPANTAFILRASRQVSAGVKFVRGLSTVIDVYAPADTSPQVSSTEYIAKYGALQTGTKISFSLQPINTVTGQAGLPLNYTAIVQA